MAADLLVFIRMRLFYGRFCRGLSLQKRNTNGMLLQGYYDDLFLYLGIKTTSTVIGEVNLEEPISSGYPAPTGLIRFSISLCVRAKREIE